MPRFWPFGGRGSAIDEAAAPAPATAPSRVVPPNGFAYGVPVGGTTEYNQGDGSADSDRRSMLEELYQAYLSCPWSSASVDTIARTITAGGLECVWNGDQKDVPEAPPQVVALRRLLEFVNPNEDIRQLMRGVISDLLVFGDAFIEVVWLGDTPIALYSLDVPSMYIIADEHGVVEKYVQITEHGQRAEFAEREVIHFSLDTPRSGLNGVSPTQKSLLPITVWLFTAATLKEVMRKGDPPNLHVDFPQEMSDTQVRLWKSQHATRNLGARNIGNPITTKGGATVNELKAFAVDEYLKTLDQKRDEILSSYGVPPSKVGVIESGNLGGGTGTSQDKTFRVNTCAPTAEAVVEKLLFHLARQAFKVPEQWVMRFGDIDWRDDKVIDEISSARLKDGRWTLNRARAEIGEGPVDGGDDAVIALSREVVRWIDVADYSQAAIAKNASTSGVVTPPAPGAASGAPAPAPGTPAPDDTIKTPGTGDVPAESTWRTAYTEQLKRVREELASGD
jgi:hypothetical protein